MTKNYAISRHGETVVAVKDAGTVISSVRPWVISNLGRSYAHRKGGKKSKKRETSEPGEIYLRAENCDG